VKSKAEALPPVASHQFKVCSLHAQSHLRELLLSICPRSVCLPVGVLACNLRSAHTEADVALKCYLGEQQH